MSTEIKVRPNMMAGDPPLNLMRRMARYFTLPRLVFLIIFIFFLVSILFPFFWMISSSFKSYAEIGARKAVYFPSALRLDAYRELFDLRNPEFWDFGRNIINSIIVAVPTAVIAVILSTLGAYAIARLQFRGKDLLLNGILLVYLIPGVLLIIPLFSMLARIGAAVGIQVRDNLPVLVLTYLTQTLPVALYMLSNYFRSIPEEIEQAGLIDGCSFLGVIWRITLPLSIPALVSVAIYTFMIAWNEFLYALIFLNDHRMFTMPIKINMIFNDPTPRPQVVMAASAVMTIPVVVMFLALERFLAEGLTAGGIKG